MRFYFRFTLCCCLGLLALSTGGQAIAADRLVVMDYQIVGNQSSGSFENTHRQRLDMADAALRNGLEKKPQYDLIASEESKAYSLKVKEAHQNNNCKGCEIAFAKQINAKLILAPWVFRLSNLVLTMHFELIDAASGKRLYKKALDFRGDNDQAWRRAIDYFLKEVDKPK